MTSLPRIMVAPNGARLQKSDHPAVPITIGETVQAAKACFEAGAQGLHAHVRDPDGQHVLDAGLYGELITEMQRMVPGMLCQITTEAIGRYTPEEQMKLVRDVNPQSVSIAWREITSAGNRETGLGFLRECHEDGIAVQHILYEATELQQLREALEPLHMWSPATQLLFVLGRYTVGQQSQLEDLDPFFDLLEEAELVPDVAVCAFGKAETQILRHVLAKGFKARIGFENNTLNDDGQVATDNAERVRSLL